MSEASEFLLFEHLGEAALCYLLNVEPEPLHHRLENGASNPPLTEAQETVLQQLVAADPVVTEWSGGQDAAYAWQEQLAGRAETAPASVGNMVRMSAGGIVPSPPASSNRSDELLAQLAVDVYPCLIVKESDGPFGQIGRGLPPSVFNNPLNLQFQELVMQDSVFSRLFSENGEDIGRNGYSRRSTGVGGSHQLWTFAEMLLSAGWALSRLASLNPSVDQFVRATLQSSQKLRSAIGRKTSSVPARVGLTGALMPEGMDLIDFGWAKLRRSDERDTFVTRQTSLRGQLTTTTQDGQAIAINFAGDMVLELDIAYGLEIGRFEPTVAMQEGITSGFTAIERTVENLRLGLLLALPDQRIILHPSWHMIFDPMIHGGMSISWSDTTRAVGLMPNRLNPDHVARWIAWSQKVEEHRSPAINVAIRRMLAAVAERRAPEDVLLDSVIVWENLFGASTETTLRITSALAWLLGNSLEDRKSRRKAYGKLYQTRSEVVHGAAGINQHRVQQDAVSAVDISLDALRVLFDQRPDLLRINSSGDRSLEVLLSGELSPGPISEPGPL